MKSQLAEFVKRKQRIAVTWSDVPGTSNGFHTQLSVEGVLHAHPKDKESYRVLPDQESAPDTYAYFRLRDVKSIDSYSRGWRIYVGS